MIVSYKHMLSYRRPYLIIPKLIEQSTWGGDYIVKLKNWGSKPELKDKKIGQSYELFGRSILALHLKDTRNSTFQPEFDYGKTGVIASRFLLSEKKDYLHLDDLVDSDPNKVLGEKIWKRYRAMPILIKINQAYGNSFQLHLKPGSIHPRWQPKPESWYYLEKGLATLGLKTNVNLASYQKTCEAIEGKMAYLSAQVMCDELDLTEAKIEAQEYIKKKNPWQFVNLVEVDKYTLIDISAGGIHHSWEENRQKFPLGNVVYEVQLDVMDPISSIRSFDQGKLKNGGGIREIHIDDYFHFLDTSAELNDPAFLQKKRQGNHILKTANYCLDILEVNTALTASTGDSFNHFYVRDGEVEITATDGSVCLTAGHSCFLPQAVGQYEIKAKTPSTILKTSIEV